MAGDFHADMICADAVETFADGAMRKFRPIAITAEMPQVKMLQFSSDDLQRDFGGGVVRKMTVPAEDALLDAPGAARVFLQQFQIVIGFEHEDVRATHAFDDELGGVSKIGEKPDAAHVRTN